MIVVWRVTERCNLSCPFCAFDRTRGGERREAGLETVLRFAAVLAAYQHETDDRVLVSWIGGEPLRWPSWREATVRLTQEFGLRVSATTNGTTLGGADVRDFIVANFAELTVSVDAADARHDAWRGWPGGFEALRRAVPDLARHKRERGHGPRVRVNTVLMHDNVGDFPALCDEVADWGVDEISFNQLGGRDRPEFFPAHRLRVEDIERLTEQLPDLKKRLAARGVRLVGGPGYLARMRASATDERWAVPDCRPGERFIFVDEQGRVAPCNYTSAQIGVPLGEVGDGAALRQLPGRLAAARAACRPEACEDCHSTQVWEKFEAGK